VLLRPLAWLTNPIENTRTAGLFHAHRPEKQPIGPVSCELPGIAEPGAIRPRTVSAEGTAPLLGCSMRYR